MSNLELIETLERNIPKEFRAQSMELIRLLDSVNANRRHGCGPEILEAIDNAWREFRCLSAELGHDIDQAAEEPKEDEEEDAGDEAVAQASVRTIIGEEAIKEATEGADISIPIDAKGATLTDVPGE